MNTNRILDGSITRKSSPPIRGWRDSGYEDEPHDSAPSPYHLHHSGSSRHPSQYLTPSDLSKLSFQHYLTVTSFPNVADNMQEVSEDKDFQFELTAIEHWFGIISRSEETATLIRLLENCTDEQKGFITEFLSMNGNGYYMGKFLQAIRRRTAS